MTDALRNAIYRSLIRCAQSFDRDPAFKAFITACSPKSESRYRKLVDKFLGNASLYRPGINGSDSVVAFVRQAYKVVDPEFSPRDQGEAADEAFHALRNLQKVLSIAKENVKPEPHEIAYTPDEEMYKRAEDGWMKHAQGRIRRASVPKPGHLLVAHPLQNGYFCEAVVLLTQTSLMHGSQGVILGRCEPEESSSNEDEDDSDSSDEDNDGEYRCRITFDPTKSRLGRQLRALIPESEFGPDTWILDSLPSEGSGVAAYRRPVRFIDDPNQHEPLEGSVAQVPVIRESTLLDGTRVAKFSYWNKEEILTTVTVGLDGKSERQMHLISALQSAGKMTEVQVSDIFRQFRLQQLPCRKISTNSQDYLGDSSQEDEVDHEDQEDVSAKEINSDSEGEYDPAEEDENEEDDPFEGIEFHIGGPRKRPKGSELPDFDRLPGTETRHLPTQRFVGGPCVGYSRLLINKQDGMNQLPGTPFFQDWNVGCSAGSSANYQSNSKPEDDQVEAGFYGVANWEGMQLEDEIADGRWFLLELEPDAWILPRDREQINSGEDSSLPPWCYRLPNWNSVLKVMGSPYKEFRRISDDFEFLEELREQD